MAATRRIDLTGEVALITGAGQGLGRGIAQAFTAWGAKVALADIDATAAAATLHDIEAAGGTGEAYPLDVTRADEVRQVVASVADDLGGLNLAVNCAGVHSVAPVVDLDPAEWRRVLEVNATGVFLVSQAAARLMIARGGPGSIVSIASTSAKSGRAGAAHYAASKFAVVGFTQALAKELAEHDILVNAVCPGSVATPMFDRLIAERGVTTADIHANQLLKRFQTGEDIAYAVAFLHTSRAMTGQAINTDGGSVFH